MFIIFDTDEDLKFNIIKKSLYNYDIVKTVSNRFILIQYKNVKFIVTSLNELEGLFLEKKISQINIIIQINNKSIKINPKNKICFYDIDYQSDKNYDLYYDVFLNLVFIRLNKELESELASELESELESEFKYYILDDYNYLNYYLMEYHKIDYKINSNNKIKKANEYEYTEIKFKENYFWAKKFVLFPDLPFLISTNNKDSNTNGTEIIDSNNNLIGLLNYSIKNINLNYDYFVTPVFTIIFNLNMIFNKKYLLFNFYNDFEKKYIKSINKEYNCLKICETIWNNYITRDINGNEIEVKDKIFDKNTLILSIDGMKINEDSNIIYYKPIPINSYIWFFKNLDIDNYYDINVEIIKPNNTIVKCEKKIYNNINLGINLSNLNYINYKNKYIFELNENLLFLLKKYILQDKLYYEFIGYIIKNMYKKNKIMIGMELYNLDNLENFENNKQVKILNETIHIKPKIFILKKYKNIEDICENYNTNKKLKNFIKIIFKKN